MFQHFRHRQDTEHEQVFIRVGLAVFALIFLFVSYQLTGKTDDRIEVLTIALLYLAFSIGFVIVLWFNASPSPLRRTFGMTVDMATITYVLAITGDTAAFLYGGYLWSIIANGFRFGKRDLYIAQALAVTGFCFAISYGAFWQQHPTFAIGLLIWLIVIPPYVSILLDRVGEAVSKAKKADMAKTHFLANMSHELRTPLNAIIGYSEMLNEEMQEKGLPDQAKDLKNIHQSGTHLLGMVNEILDLSKIEEGKMDVFYEDISIQELTNDVAATIQPLAEKNANQLAIHVAADISILRTDITKIRQILFNLLSNACKFTHNGHVSLTVRKKQIAHNECLEFTVTDDGIGIAHDNIESVFQPFQQESLDTSKKFGGTGLGLAISKRFCELMGGTLMIESTKGEGCVFTVLLPTTPSEAVKSAAS